jgi:pimeloyl-ACP methyl ester carboxylesterase
MPEQSLRMQSACLAPLLRLGKSAKKPILVGHSLGGPVAARLAMDYPDEVGGLILVAPSIDPELEKKNGIVPSVPLSRFVGYFPPNLM